jgi:hypothetical protein
MLGYAQRQHRIEQGGVQCLGVGRSCRLPTINPSSGIDLETALPQYSALSLLRPQLLAMMVLMQLQ